MRHPVSRVIRVLDVARKEIHDLGPDEPILRGPYELFHPEGPVHRRGSMIEWSQAKEPRSARVVPVTLGETHPGERVLVRLAPYDAEDDWWLCEVQAVDGVQATP